MDAREIAKLAYQALEEKKAKDIKIIDIRDISVIADYFVIADGENQNQLQAMRDSVDETLLKAKVEAKQVEGNQKSTWILMDYGDIIVHIFSKEDRLFYDLERIWRDGCLIDPESLQIKKKYNLPAAYFAAGFLIEKVLIKRNGIHQKQLQEQIYFPQ